MTSRMLSPDPKWHPGNVIYGDDPENTVPDIYAIMQSSNLYVYAVNNPIMFSDPSGLEIWLIGTKEERQQILDNLNLLTSDTLTMNLIDGGRHWVVSISDNK